MEDEDEEALRGVEHGEDVGNGHRLLAEEEEAHDPRQAQEHLKGHGSLNPRPDEQRQSRKRYSTLQQNSVSKRQTRHLFWCLGSTT